MMSTEHLEYAILNYGTPLYAFDTDKLDDQAHRFRKTIAGRAGLCFAMKANPFLLPAMAARAERIEVCSMGEFRICQAKKIPLHKLLISGVLKKKENFQEILEICQNQSIYSIESLGQMEQAAEWSRKNGKRIPVLLRLTSGNQFGMDKDLIWNILQARELFPSLKIRGIHYFSGTRKKIEKICGELEELDDYLAKLEAKTGYRMEELEYGPGIAAACFEGEEEKCTEDLAALCGRIQEMKWKGKLTLEMGRAFAASCGYYLTGVHDIKRNEGVNYCIVDGGIHQLQYDGQIRGMYRPKIRVCPEHAGEDTKKWTVCGSLCTSNDILAQNVTFSGLRRGDVLVFENAGAYSATEGMALFLSHALPGVALFSQTAGWQLVRRKSPTYQWNTGKETEDEEFTAYFKGN